MNAVIYPQSNLEIYKAIQPEQKPVVLYFTTTTCNVCKSVFPRLEELMQAYPQKFYKIDAEQFPELAGQNRVFTVPTILVFAEGKEVLRESRFIDFNKIQRILELINS
jgi:thioredoxin-like negative regulator of GroEL